MKRLLLMMATAVLLGACTHQAASPPPADAASAPPAPAPATPTTATPAAPATPLVGPPKLVLPNGLDVDLNADGEPERVAGPLGEWSDQPVVVYDQMGKPLFTSVSNYIKRAFVQVLSVPGQDRPALLYQFDPGIVGRNTTLVWFGPSGETSQTAGWHPKVHETNAETLVADADSVVVVAGSLHDPAGHRFERRYKVSLRLPSGNLSFWSSADLQFEGFEAPSEYPKSPEGVLEAALVAKAYGIEDEIPRYFGDPAAAAAFAAARGPSRPPYDVWRFEVGKLILPTKDQEPIKIEAQPLGPQGGTTDFIFEVGEYEGGTRYYGTVTFAPAPDGRWTIQDLKIDRDMFIY